MKDVYKYAKVFLLVLILGLSCQGFTSKAAPFAGQTIDGKLYVEPGTVYVAPNGIFLNIKGDLIPVEGVSMDECGVYAIGYQSMRMVTCPRCGRSYNIDRYSDRCPHIGEKVQRSS